MSGSDATSPSEGAQNLSEEAEGLLNGDAPLEQSLSTPTGLELVQSGGGSSFESFSHDDDLQDGFSGDMTSASNDTDENGPRKPGKTAPLHQQGGSEDEDQSVLSTKSTQTSETYDYDDDTIELDDPLCTPHQHAGRRSQSASPQRPLLSQSLMKKRRRQQESPQVEPLLDPSFHNMDSNNPRDNNDNSGEAVVVLGVDISHLSAPSQFLVCAAGVFGFNLSFGYLQEFVAVEILNRNLGLFLALLQFSGYTAMSYVLRNSNRKANNNAKTSPSTSPTAASTLPSSSPSSGNNNNKNIQNSLQKQKQQQAGYLPVPNYMYIAVGVLSAIDMAMTNMAMLYINYPAKTLMKSSRVVFTMIFGVLMAGKRYKVRDYIVVLCMVAGLAIFMQADASSSAVFEPMGVIMLTVSLLCDGAVNIMSETIMKTYGVGQDELIFRTFSFALIPLIGVATFNGDLRIGLIWLMKPGTYDEWNAGASVDEVSWNVLGKLVMIALFSSMGFLGSSCSAAITKNFGALAMSITSTARRAATLFISFFMFDNQCTFEHITGAFIFIAALTTKSFFSRSKGPKAQAPLLPPPVGTGEDLEMQRANKT